MNDIYNTKMILEMIKNNEINVQILGRGIPNIEYILNKEINGEKLSFNEKMSRDNLNHALKKHYNIELEPLQKVQSVQKTGDGAIKSWWSNRSTTMKAVIILLPLGVVNPFFASLALALLLFKAIFGICRTVDPHGDMTSWAPATRLREQNKKLDEQNELLRKIAEKED